MRFATILCRRGVRLVLIEGQRSIDVELLGQLAGAKLPGTMLDLIAAGPNVLDSIRELALRYREWREVCIPLEQAQILAPLPRPPRNIFGVGMNYATHVEEASRTMATSQTAPSKPVYFTKPPSAVVGPDQPILHHVEVTQQLDWEAELAVVIGRGGKKISAAAALSHVFGYTCINDISARDCRREGQWFSAKGHDGSAPLGPWIVTADEIADPQALDIALSVNGEVMQRSNTRHMIFNVARLIEDLSQFVTLEPGDIIASGTPAGVGIGRTPPRFLKAGDIVSMTIESIGTLANTVVAT